MRGICTENILIWGFPLKRIKQTDKWTDKLTDGRSKKDELLKDDKLITHTQTISKFLQVFKNFFNEGQTQQFNMVFTY